MPEENPISIRSGIVEFLRRELIGPDPRPNQAHLNNGDEVLRPQDPPRMRYGAGVLFPSNTQVGGQDSSTNEELDVLEDDSEPEELVGPETAIESLATETDDSAENEINLANQFLPSAMGLTALIRLPERLRVTIKGARYEKRTEIGVGKQDQNGNWQPHHYRITFEREIILDCEKLRLREPKVMAPRIFIDSGNPDMRLEFHVFSRPYAHATNPASDRMVTFSLVNRTVMSGTRPKDGECFFQCEFSVEAVDESRCFIEYPEKPSDDSDDEEKSLRLLYRHRKTFSVGHGCAAFWPEGEEASTNLIRTDSLPTYEIKPILPREIEGLTLSMAKLSSQTDGMAIQICRDLADAYKKWIDFQYDTVMRADFPGEYRSTAVSHLELCKKCHSRIEEGLSLIASDSQVRTAFAWMNRAMLDQQLHYDLSANHRRNWVPVEGRLTPDSGYVRPDLGSPTKGKGLWRSFQLAFILMNISGSSRRDSSDRSIVDLIWFPTGGGKTEAYLGLTAFSIFYRRLADKNDSGTTVLMRYTLRLLTTQQFQRAASLICACEIIRRENPEQLGSVRISIGLWVGGDVTPNKHVNANPPGAVQVLQKLLTEGKPNKFIVLTCPWCGIAMGPVRVGDSYRTPGYKKSGNSVYFKCEDPGCEFHDDRGLPLLVVDEAIYTERPTLVIGTVDKFAMLPWYPESRRLFGLDSTVRLSPPDLIIQDELHLISGALGSMVGMYESTIDELCTHHVSGKKYPAKIVASTATICKAHDQIHSLYARNAFLFPPQALRAGDSFFAEERTYDKNGNSLPGRLYVGVFGSALSSHVTAQIRVMAALLQAPKCQGTDSASALDPYWTVMTYFNSLRELGHAATLIRADIRDYLNAMWDRLEIHKPTAGSNLPDIRRFINRDLELTSRIQSGEITDVLQQLFNQYVGAGDYRVVDVCLATNMIQVGLDVSRLGLMTVVGQPKTTSEYIQATSRVGRSASGPGLVVTVFNTAKPRDRSHFEHFRSYHQNIYRWVEPTSITPFAVPVRERALHAQLVTLVRFLGDGSLFSSPRPEPSREILEKFREIIVARIRQVDSEESAHAEAMLREFEDRWLGVSPSKYGHFGPPPLETPLMHPAGTEPRSAWANRSKATPSSMRNVDAGCAAEVIRQFPQPLS